MALERIEFPITGKVISVNISHGSVVEEGDILCLFESMKMENPIMAPVGGKVVELNLLVGQVVEAGDIVAVIEY
ncbi:biotin/lipoyl-containing protein [Chloroflexota bacterium]